MRGTGTITPTSAARRRVWVSLLLGLIFSLLFLVPLLSWINLRGSLQVLAGLEARRLWVPLLITIVSLPLRPWRWQVIFPEAARPRFWQCFRVLAVGIMTNNVVPGRGGDLLRCFLIAPKDSLIRPSLALGTLGLEKILDGLALLGVLLAASLFLSPPSWFGRLASSSALLFGVAVLISLLLRYRADRIFALLRSVLQTLGLPGAGDEMVRFLARFAEGLIAVNSAVRCATLCLLTAWIWIGEAAEVWALAMALGVPLSLPAATVVAAIIGLGLTIPSGPASIGTYEFFSVGGLALFGVRPEKALALTLLMHAWSVAVTTALGLASLAIGGIRFAQVTQGSMNATDRS